jgi:DNA-binding NarL/FixJ family response regulator
MLAREVDPGGFPATDGEDSQPGHCPASVAVAVPGILMAEALGRALRDSGLYVVGAYATLAALLEKVHRCRPTVAIADADLREADGAPDLLARLRAAGPDTRLVVLAAAVDRSLAREVVEQSARAVILKSTPIADAVGVLEQVIRGRTSFPAACLVEASDRKEPRDLSARQLEVLEQLAMGRSNEEIARSLFISTNTVKFHLRAIYGRLGVHNRVHASRLLATRRVV